jgi:SAM-dependent methyltransferase
MSETARHDSWGAGDAYDAYMGRWSRRVAPRFLDWLGLPGKLDWLDIGCGTGALSATILERCDPSSLVGLDPSQGFVDKARANVVDRRAEFRVGDAQSLDVATASRDAIVSALCLNFVPDRAKALAEMKRVARSGATVAFYVWDYPGGGLEFLRRFWTVASSLDPKSEELAEDRRFPFCTPAALTSLAGDAGLSAVECIPLEVETVFDDFEDYWRPFTLGAGPAPGYCMSLSPEARERLKGELSEALPRGDDGRIPLKARAWAIRSVAG